MPTSREPSIPAPAASAQLIATPALIADTCPPSDPSDSSNLPPTTNPSATSDPSDLASESETQNTEPETGSLQPELKTVTALPKLRRTRPRIGKVASLPDHLRNWVNEQLVQRVPAHFISKQLEREGYPGINSKNVSNWRIGGFQDYLKQTESATERERRWNSLLALAREEGPAFDAAAMQMAIGQYHEVLCGVQPTTVTALISGKPEYYFRLNTGLAGLMKAYLGLGRLKKISPSSRLNPAIAGASNIDGEKNGGLTVEERDEVRRSLGIFPPPPKPQDVPPTPEQPATPALTEHVP